MTVEGVRAVRDEIERRVRHCPPISGRHHMCGSVRSSPRRGSSCWSSHSPGPDGPRARRPRSVPTSEPRTGSRRRPRSRTGR
jgi:hypothetical protein